MKDITLTSTPAVVTILERSEITERQDRIIRRAQMRASGVTAKLQVATEAQADALPMTAALQLSDIDFDILDSMSEAFVTIMVVKWSKDEWSVDRIADLPKTVFDELADICLREYIDAPDFSPDGVVDPLADTAG